MPKDKEALNGKAVANGKVAVSGKVALLQPTAANPKARAKAKVTTREKADARIADDCTMPKPVGISPRISPPALRPSSNRDSLRLGSPSNTSSGRRTKELRPALRILHNKAGLLGHRAHHRVISDKTYLHKKQKRQRSLHSYVIVTCQEEPMPPERSCLSAQLLEPQVDGCGTLAALRASLTLFCWTMYTTRRSLIDSWASIRSGAMCR